MTDRPTDLCQYGNCVINGPGIVGGDCVCDGKPITTPGSLADKRLASAIRQIDSLKSHLETAQENSAFIVTSLKRTIAERDATIRSLSLKVEELEKEVSAVSSNPPAPSRYEPAVTLASRGTIDFAELGRDVREATIGVREDWDFEGLFPGHYTLPQMNFNSLNRIVSKYADSSLTAGHVPETPGGQLEPNLPTSSPSPHGEPE